MKTAFIKAAAWTVLLAAPTAFSQIQFVDVSAGAGINYSGESYGVSWGDYNGDGAPDLFVNHHRSAPGLYLNRTDGSFDNRYDEVDTWHLFPTRDQHGGSWADFDNDGDADLMVSLGSKAPTQFMINENAVLSDHITDYAIDPVKYWQGRLPVWFDFNGDGLLDFAMATTNGPFHMFQQQDDDFVKKNSASGSTCTGTAYGQLADVNFDGQPEIICAAQVSFPYRIYDYSTMPFINLTSTIPQTANAVDSVVADFDGDLRDDVLVVTGKIRVSGAEAVSSNRVEGHIISDNASERGFTFKTTGDISVTLHWSAKSVNNVRIGASGMHPAQPPTGTPITFTLSAGDPDVIGIQPHDGSTPSSIYFGYDPATTTWTVINASGTTAAGAEGAWSYAYVNVDSTASVSDVVATNLTAGDRPSAPVLFTNPTGNAYVDSTAAAQLTTQLSCVGAAAADFDNDMDQDLYLVCRNAVSNAQDVLYENLGGGVFAPVANAGGATGPTGAGAGLGENVALADYDLDGFVDIFQTNGLALFPENPYSNGGPDKLYRNVPNGNKWVELDLIGTASNRDGVGAVVTVSAGSVAQRKTQDGGYHRWAQSFKRVHFGLGTNATADIQILWPSGHLDVFPNVASNHIYRVTEAGSIVELPPPADPGPSACGDPKYNKSVDRAVFIWRNCFTDVWSMRVSPGNTTFTASGLVKSSQPFGSVTPFNNEANDVLNTSNPFQIAHTFKLAGSSHDGFDFTFPAGSSTCFTTDPGPGLPVLMGAARNQMSGPFDLTTFGACATVPELSINDVTVSEGAGNASFTVSLSAATSSPVTVSYATANGTAIEPDDYAAQSNTLTFTPGNPLTQAVDIPLVDDSSQESAETFTVALSNPSGATLGDASGVATLTDNEISACGAPSYNKSVDIGVFVWRNCSTGLWSVRASGGTGSYTYAGSVSSSVPFSSVTGFSLEASDVLDTSNPLLISHSLVLGSSAQDGFDFTFPAEAGVCYGIGTSPSIPVFVGQAKALVAAPFNLANFGACN